MSHGRGLRRIGEHPVREVHDDGREAQAAVAAEVSRNLVLVDGLLCHRAPAPYAGVSSVSGHQVVTAQAARPLLDPWEALPDARAREPWAAFPLGSEGAAAYAEGLAARCAGPRPGKVNLFLDDLEVVDRAAYDAAYGASPSELLARCWETFASGIAPWLKDVGDDVVGQYIAARAAVSAAARMQ